MQQEQERESRGRLYLCATPIGNLQDMTLRGIQVLQTVDLIAAEDTRNSRKLLQQFQIATPLTSYHQNNRMEKGKALVKKMQQGAKIALITDAGTPGISDPGEELVKMCRQENIAVVPLPGACAAICGLIVSGLSARRFVFEGFLPKEKKEQREVLQELSQEMRTIVLYEAPHRLKKTLLLLLETLGDRKVTLCRELTKLHEEVLATTLAEAIRYYDERTPQGEYVLVLEGKSRETKKQEEVAQWEELSVKEHMACYEKSGLEKKDAMKQVAKDRGVGKRDIYQALLEE